MSALSGMVFTVKADIKDLEKKMADAAKQTETFAKKSTTSFDTVGKSIKKLSDVKVDIGGNLVQGFKQGETAAKGFGNAASNALEGFGESAKQATSFLGPIGGILASIGISVAVAFATAVIGKWINSISEATAAIKLMLERQQLLNDIQAEGNKNAAKELTSLKIIYDASQNVNLSMADRIKAAKALQDQYPETFKNFTQEQILLGNAKSGYDSLTASILKQSLAKAALGKLSDIAAQKLDIEFQKLKIISKTNQEIDAVREKQMKDVVTLPGVGGALQLELNPLSTRDQKVQITTRRNEALKVQNGLLAGIISKEKFITDFIGSANLLDAAIGKTKGDKEVKVKTLKITPDKVEIEKVGEIKLNTERRTSAAKLDDGTFGTTVTNSPKIKVEINKEAYQKSLDDLTGVTQARLATIGGIISGTVSNIVSGLAETIGAAISGKGNFGDIFSGIFKSLAGGLKTLGKYLIETGIKIQIAKKALFSNPVAGIAAGFALLALGSFIDAKLSKTPAFANGVQNFGGGVALVGERGPELVNLPRGADVIPNNQLGGRIGGGGGDVNVSGQFIVRGTDLVAVLDKANNRINRNS